ncbi:MAG: PIN domain-containing protein [Bryobacteraceae bacterium]
MQEFWSTGNGVLSTQVLQEFYVNITRKWRPPLSPSAAREIVRSYAKWVHAPATPSTVIRASEIAEAYQLSFWDSLIIASAEQQSASIILTEDLNDGQRVAGIQIVDPFLHPTFQLPA